MRPLLFAFVAGCTAPTVPDPPRVLSVTLSPAEPTVGDTITATVALADDRDRFEIAWQVDDRPVRRKADTALSGAFRKHQPVRVTITPTRGAVRGEPVVSDAVVVVDSAPAIEGSAAITPEAPRSRLHDLVCVPPAATSVTDADDDAITWTFAWTRDDAPVAVGVAIDGAWPGDTIPADVTVDGERWACTAIASDGDLDVALPPVEVTIDLGVTPAFGVPVSGLGVSCAVDRAGAVRCWGQDGPDRLASPPPGRYARVWFGVGFACGLRTDDLTLACWGAADPRAEPPPGPVLDAALGEAHGCALDIDHTVACWGWDGDGQASPPDGEFRALFAGDATTCALDADHHAVCWGADVGADALAEDRLVELAVGSDHVCGLTVDGRLRCAGADGFGQASPPEGTWSAVAVHGGETCALRADGAVVCFGDLDDTFAVGATSLSMTYGTSWCARTPTGVTCGSTDVSRRPSAWGEDTAPIERWTTIALEERLVCGLDASGHAACLGAWGPVGLPVDALDAVAAGGDVACGLRRADHHPVCWGWLDRAGLGAPPDVALDAIAVGDGFACGLGAQGTPICWGARAPSPPDVPLTTLSAALDYACGLTSGGTIVCFGVADDRARPPAGAFVAIDLAREHGCGLRGSGRITCWGRRDVPEEAIGPFTAVAVADDRACGLGRKGQPSCWGAKPVGATEPDVPIALVDLVAGTDRVCGRRADGGVVCWGAIRRQPLP